MTSKIIKSFAAFFFLFIFAANAELKVDIIAGNTEPVPIAIQKFETDAKDAAAIRDVLEADLKSTGLFRIINPNASEGVLSPAFASGITAYSVSVAGSVDSITLSATVASPYATIAAGVLGKKALAVGTNIFPIAIIAQDGMTTKNYIVIVTRATASGNDAVGAGRAPSLRVYPNPVANELFINSESRIRNVS